MKCTDYRERLGIGYTKREKLRAFLVKMNNALSVLDYDGKMRNQISEGEFYNYCDLTATPFRDHPYYGICSYYEIIRRELQDCETSFQDYLFTFMAFINCQSDSDDKFVKKQTFLNVLKNNARDMAMPIEIIEDDDGYFAFPEGAKELDDAIVSQTLDWLTKYPKTRKKFCEALRRYTDKAHDNISDIADDFRKSLETFFQEFFQSKKTLENMKTTYGDYLKANGIPAEVANNFQALLGTYAVYMNNNAKHHDNANENALEYIMYQTGNIIRLLVQLQRNNEVNGQQAAE